MELVADDGSAAAADEAGAGASRALFALDRKHLSADAEMARRFGGGGAGFRAKKTIVERREHGGWGVEALLMGWARV